MAVRIMIPIVGKMGQKYDKVKLVEWKVKEGDQVSKGNAILLLETIKASVELEAEVSGYLHILVPAGESRIVGKVAGLIAETEEELVQLQKTSSWELTQT